MNTLCGYNDPYQYTWDEEFIEGGSVIPVDNQQNDPFQFTVFEIVNDNSQKDGQPYDPVQLIFSNLLQKINENLTSSSDNKMGIFARTMESLRYSSRSNEYVFFAFLG